MAIIDGGTGSNDEDVDDVVVDDDEVGGEGIDGDDEVTCLTWVDLDSALGSSDGSHFNTDDSFVVKVFQGSLFDMATSFERCETMSQNCFILDGFSVQFGVCVK